MAGMLPDQALDVLLLLNTGRLPDQARRGADLACVAGVGLAQNGVAESRHHLAALQSVPYKFFHFILCGRGPDLQTSET